METTQQATASAFVESIKAQFPEQLKQSRGTLVGNASYLNFPTQREEDWKYTGISFLQKEKYNFSRFTETIDISAFRQDKNAALIVFVNGFFRSDLSSELPEGLQFSDSVDHEFPETGERKNVFTGISDAFFTGGIHIQVQKSVEKPVEVLFLSAGGQSVSVVKNHIEISKSASARFRFLFRSADSSSYLTNSITTIHVSANAQFELDQLQFESPAATHYNRTDVTQHRDSKFSINTFSLDGKLIRNDLNIISEGENTETHMRGLYMVNGQQHVDNHTLMDHRVPNCYSNELYKGVMDGKATGVFNGKVFVRRDAQKINAFQSNANVLLSDDARINSKPELEIYADDVKCSHGSTTGQMDEEALFYLRARGIGEESAKKLLIRAYAGEVLDAISDESFRLYLEELIDSRFHWNNV